MSNALIAVVASLVFVGLETVIYFGIQHVKNSTPLGRKIPAAVPVTLMAVDLVVMGLVLAAVFGK